MKRKPEGSEISRLTIKLRRDQAIRLRLTLLAWSEKQGRRVTMIELVQAIIDNFLDDPDDPDPKAKS